MMPRLRFALLCVLATICLPPTATVAQQVPSRLDRDMLRDAVEREVRFPHLQELRLGVPAEMDFPHQTSEATRTTSVGPLVLPPPDNATAAENDERLAGYFKSNSAQLHAATKPPAVENAIPIYVAAAVVGIVLVIAAAVSTMLSIKRRRSSHIPS